MRKPTEIPRRSEISADRIPNAIKRIERRLGDLEQTREKFKSDLPPDGISNILVNDINATIDEVFGTGTLDAKDFKVAGHWFSDTGGGSNNFEAFHDGIDRAIEVLRAAILRLRERAESDDGNSGAKVLRAYEGLELHAEISRAASDLYRNGHYSNAIEDAVKALNSLVRLRSGAEGDGVPLMQSVFSPKNPILRFNDLRDQSDINEQTGFMMLFAGAVAGLRNPRAHALIKDDPEQTLEFIAFVSLLAKLLDGAKKGPPPTS